MKKPIYILIAFILVISFSMAWQQSALRQDAEFRGHDRTG